MTLLERENIVNSSEKTGVDHVKTNHYNIDKLTTRKHAEITHKSINRIFPKTTNSKNTNTRHT